jgi:ABC-type dipeptide/oligopeptide/nickel transport system permease component
MLWILLTLVFFMMRVAPGDPVTAALGGRLPEKELQERRHAAGYDKPLVVQYVDYLGDVARLNFGTTITDDRPVTDVIVENGSATLELTFWAMVVALSVGIGLGLLAGRLRDSGADVSIRMFGIVVYAMPAFFLGFLAQLLFGERLGWLPTSRPGQPERCSFLPAHAHAPLPDRCDHLRRLGHLQRRRAAPDPARGHAGPDHRRCPDPAGARERAADDEGRLHRSRPRARHRREVGRLPPCVSRTPWCRW